MSTLKLIVSAKIISYLVEQSLGGLEEGEASQSSCLWEVFEELCVSSGVGAGQGEEWKQSQQPEITNIL